MRRRHHRIDYVEFNVTNMEEAKSFYSKAFGWTFNDYGPSYCGICGDGYHEQGGLALADYVATAGSTMVVLYSDNLEASLQSVTRAGGEIVREPFYFPGGRRFEFLDPSGNRLAVWTDFSI